MAEEAIKAVFILLLLFCLLLHCCYVQWSRLWLMAILWRSDLQNILSSYFSYFWWCLQIVLLDKEAKQRLVAICSWLLWRQLYSSLDLPHQARATAALNQHSIGYSSVHLQVVRQWGSLTPLLVGDVSFVLAAIYQKGCFFSKCQPSLRWRILTKRKARCWTF